MTVATFAGFARGFRNSRASDTSDTNRKPTTPRADKGDPEPERRQLRGQIAGIIQELLNTPELSDTDRRLLYISNAVVFLLAGR
jgi:hypothetical protein